MKNIFLLIFSLLFVSISYAQTTIKIANPRHKSISKNTIEKKKNINSTQKLEGSIISLSPYVPGAFTTLKMALKLTNLDEEYVDSLAITFPAGITPVSSPNNPFTVAIDGQPSEALNGVFGQTISWGDNDNNYGGIATPLSPTAPASKYFFSVNVNVAASLSGPVTANFFASGDRFPLVDTDTTIIYLDAFGNVIDSINFFIVDTIVYAIDTVAGPKDLVGTFSILQGAPKNLNLGIIFIKPKNATKFRNCNYGTDSLVAEVINIGNTTEFNYSVSYSINGSPLITRTIPDLIVPGDTFLISLAPFNFNASTIYNIIGKVQSAPTENDLTNNTIQTNIVNSNSFPITTSIFNNGLETSYEQSSISIVGNAASVTDISYLNYHTGGAALFTTVSSSNPDGVYESLIILPCMDVKIGKTYRISFWKRTNAALGGNGTTGVFTSINNNMIITNSVILKAFNKTLPLDEWIKDSIDYKATATEVRYFAIGGQGTTTDSTQMNCRLDDISITNLGLILDVKENSSTNTLSIYPNPSSGLFTLDIANSFSKIKVYNILGEVVYTGLNLSRGINSLNFSSLPKGSYFIKLSNDNVTETITKKIVIQ